MARNGKPIRLILTVSGIMGGLGLFLLALLLEPANAPAEPVPATWERFTSYPADSCLGEGEKLGDWTVLSSGGGCVKVESDPARSWLHIEPARSSAGLALGPAGSDFEFEADIMTVTSVAGAADNRAAWLVWNYTDEEHYHYFIPGPLGWELGRMEPGGNTVLASAAQPSFPIGAWHRIKLRQTGGKIEVSAGGTMLAAVQAPESGQIGLYSAGAHSHFTNIRHQSLAP